MILTRRFGALAARRVVTDDTVTEQQRHRDLPALDVERASSREDSAA